MEELFLDNELNDQLRTNGFVKFDCYTPAQVEALMKLYQKEKPLFWNKPVYCNVFRDLPVKNRKISETIISSVLKNKILNESAFDIVGGCFIVKKGKKKNEVGLHQDWTITDEAKRESYVMWASLVDTSKKNGAIVVLPKSNERFKGIIRSNSFDSLYIPIDEKITDKIRVMEIKAGEGIIYSSALFHGSFKNDTKEDRVAVAASILNKRAERVYYHYDDREDLIYKLRMPDDFYLTYQPKLKKISIQDELEVLAIETGPPEILTTQKVLG